MKLYTAYAPLFRASRVPVQLEARGDGITQLVFPNQKTELSALFATHEIVAGSDDEARPNELRWRPMHFT